MSGRGILCSYVWENGRRELPEVLSLPCTRPSHTLLCVIPKLIHLHTFTACHCRESVEGLLDALMPNDMLRYHVSVEPVYRMCDLCTAYIYGCYNAQ